MRDIRRLYFYAVSVVSLEVVIWGVIGLLRSVVNNAIGGQISLLASSLALILVGVPVFLIHWWVAQRGALRDREERAARIRALFLYGVLGGMLVPAVQNGLTLINRFTLVVLGLQWKPIVGTGQTLGDNLIAIAVNLGMAVYFYSVLKSDWRAQLPGSSLVEMRRLYRFLWMVYGLGIGVVGLQQVLHSIFYIPQGIGGRTSYFFANGLALLIGGIPLWVAFWRILQKAADEPAEQQSMLRLVMLYLLSLAGVGTVLVEASQIITFLLRWALGSSQTFNSILLALGQPISVIIPLGGVWFYYGRQLSLNIEKLPEEPRRAGLHRLYLYILVAIGLGATILGLQQLIAFAISAAVTQQVGSVAMRNQISSALAALIIGIPLWLTTWRPMDAEARRSDDAGDYARRSIVRKSFLYLALFASVIGVMVSAGEGIYQIISHLMGSPVRNLLQSELNALQTLIIFALSLAYHLSALRQDGRLAERSLALLHNQFPVLLIDAGQGFKEEISEAMQRFAPQIPVSHWAVDQELAETQGAAIKAVILPSTLATQPPDMLRSWMENHPGLRLVVPASQAGWEWVGSISRTGRELAQQTALAVRQMAEGQPVRFSPPTNPWAIAGYVFAALFSLEILFFLIALAASLL